MVMGLLAILLRLLELLEFEMICVGSAFLLLYGTSKRSVMILSTSILQD